MRLAGRGGPAKERRRSGGASEGPNPHIFPACGAKKSRLATLADLIKMSEVEWLVVGASETVRKQTVTLRKSLADFRSSPQNLVLCRILFPRDFY